MDKRAEFQSFDTASRPDQGAPRVAALRDCFPKLGVDGVLVPRADAHQGEYVAPCDARLLWLSGFSGSAGFCAVLKDQVGIFIDGRYRLQVRDEVDLDIFTPVDWPKTKLETWLPTALPKGGVIGFDPWLHTMAEIDRLAEAVAGHQITLRPLAENPIDALWSDRPPPPDGKASAYPLRYAGRSAVEKCSEVGLDLAAQGVSAAVLSLPDSICWLLNIRGADLPHLPVVQAFAILSSTGSITVFADPAKFADVDLPDQVTLYPLDRFEERLRQEANSGPIRLDPKTAPHKLRMILAEAGAEIDEGPEPCTLPKARKHPAEIDATRAAHLRDGAAMVRFLHWFDHRAPQGGLTEIECVCALERFRRETGALQDISFDTIAGAGAHGAIVHYRVSEATNAPLAPNTLFLMDSGGQYLDGTTDITRTLPVGDVGLEEKQAFTQVLRGMIALSRARFPKGLAGRDLDALARAPLWAAGRDYDHGTGHGVGVYLSVHEAPQRISRASDVPLEVGMILSNEPGFYKEGAYGIRIENLIVVQEAAPIAGGDARAMLEFETLTLAPIDRRLVVSHDMAAADTAWLNEYHARVAEALMPLVPPETQAWLRQATAPIA